MAATKKKVKIKKDSEYTITAKDIAKAIDNFLENISRSDVNDGIKLFFEIEWEHFDFSKDDKLFCESYMSGEVTPNNNKASTKELQEIQNALNHPEYGAFMPEWRAHKILSLENVGDEFIGFGVEVVINGLKVSKGPAVITQDI